MGRSARRGAEEPRSASRNGRRSATTIYRIKQEELPRRGSWSTSSTACAPSPSTSFEGSHDEIDVNIDKIDVRTFRELAQLRRRLVPFEKPLGRARPYGPKGTMAATLDTRAVAASAGGPPRASCEEFHLSLSSARPKIMN